MPAFARKAPLHDGIQRAIGAAAVSVTVLLVLAHVGGNLDRADGSRSTPAATGADGSRAVPGDLRDQLAAVLVEAVPDVHVPPLVEHLRALPRLETSGGASLASGVRPHGAGTAGAGLGFLATTALGVVAGLVLVGLFLLRGVLARAREYEALRASGAESRALVRMIASEALVSSAIGVAAGGALASAAGAGLRLGSSHRPLLLLATSLLALAPCAATAVLSLARVSARRVVGLGRAAAA